MAAVVWFDLIGLILSLLVLFGVACCGVLVWLITLIRLGCYVCSGCLLFDFCLVYNCVRVRF